VYSLRAVFLAPPTWPVRAGVVSKQWKNIDLIRLILSFRDQAQALFWSGEPDFLLPADNEGGANRGEAAEGHKSFPFQGCIRYS